MERAIAYLTRYNRLELIAVMYALWNLRSKGMRADGRNTALGALAEFLASQRSAIAQVIGDVLGVYVAVHFLRRVLKLARDLRFLNFLTVKNSVGGRIVDVLSNLPIVKDKIEAEYTKMEKELEKAIKPANREIQYELPKKGLEGEVILEKMKAYTTQEKPKWSDGWVSGAVYHGEDGLMELQNKAYALYSLSNPLHPDIWPSVMKFDAEIVSMTASFLNGGCKTVCGSVTSGGTESILMAVKAMRQYAQEKLGIHEPEIVAPITAHPGLDKACDILKIKLVHVPVDKDTQIVNPRTLKHYISPDTIMIYASAPQYPHGTIDPIRELSEIAVSYGIGLHVDCCLGGFVLPFARKLGYDIPAFDFGLPGVTTMSVDTHKFAYAVKGTSVVLYRSRELRNHQYFTFPNWPGGLYATPSTAGSRPGGLVAACWASMMNMGEDGYLQCTRQIMEAQRKIKEAVKEIPGIKLVGDPIAMIVAFRSDDFNVYILGDLLSKRGWSLNSLQLPPSIHICCTVANSKKVDRFIKDLRECTAVALQDPNKIDKDGSAPIYGMASSMPAGPIKTMLKTYTDVVLKP